MREYLGFKADDANTEQKASKQEAGSDSTDVPLKPAPLHKLSASLRLDNSIWSK